MRSLEGIVTLVVEASDSVSGVARVALEISTGEDGGWHRVAEANRQPFALQWYTTALRDEEYSLRIIAWDGSGNVSEGVPVTAGVANEPAQAELVDPGQYLRGRVNSLARGNDKRTARMISHFAAGGFDEWRALGTARPRSISPSIAINWPTAPTSCVSRRSEPAVIPPSRVDSAPTSSITRRPGW